MAAFLVQEGNSRFTNGHDRIREHRHVSGFREPGCQVLDFDPNQITRSGRHASPMVKINALQIENRNVRIAQEIVTSHIWSISYSSYQIILLQGNLI
jgi:hypothetical protein